jgi:acetyl-CoA decarbonylase/synthase complex subunit delta
MSFEIHKEKWPGSVLEVVIGATPEAGGTRQKTVTVGGRTTLPFLHFEGALPHSPVVAMEVWDVRPEWPERLTAALGPVLDDPAAWAQQCVACGADLICLRLAGTNPEGKDAGPDEAAAVVRAVLAAVDVPLIIIGCGNDEKDNLVFPRVCEAAAKERCIVGPVTKDNYKTIAAVAMANGHGLIAQGPVDVNIQKQVSTLLEEMGVKQEDIVMDPTTGALGYGLEYTYSVMERISLAALQGERNLASPMIVFPGFEAWRAKEAKEAPPADEAEGVDQGVLWELLTATAFLQSGADILVMVHPEAVRALKNHIEVLSQKGDVVN